jgi:predicted  nucleic acid-binding Zn ribbon protein
VPVFTLPVSDQIKEELLFWRRDYEAFDRIWFRSGALEIQAYRLMADPRSDLSQEGRRLCREMEESTCIPTFYYLMRYWSRSRNEEERLCPGCGKDWKALEPEFGERFSRFHFKCDPCRLVSHVGKSAEGVRRARIGEYVPPKPTSRKTKP